jgi:hypothetical protein
MRFTTLRLARDRRGSTVRTLVVVALAIVLLRTAPEPLAQSGAADRWVATWTTAEVGRLQTPAPPVPGPAPFMANTRCPAPLTPPVAAPPGQTFAPPPYIQFTNQTLRQIVHSSIGGIKARVVLSNAYGTAPVTIGGG